MRLAIAPFVQRHDNCCASVHTRNGLLAIGALEDHVRWQVSREVQRLGRKERFTALKNPFVSHQASYV